MGKANTHTPHEFTIAASVKMFYAIIAVVLVVFSVIFINKGLSQKPLLWLLPLTFLTGAVLIVVSFMKRKIVIDETSMLCVSLFSRKELQLADIKGYRLAHKLIEIVPQTAPPSVLRIVNFIDFNKSAEFVTWLKANFQDLNALDLEAERQRFLMDETFGSSINERQAKLKLAKEIALAYNIWAGIIGFILVFFTQQFTFIILLILPIIGIVLLYNFRLIKFLSDKNRSIHPYIFIGFAVPSIALVFKIIEFNFMRTEKLWLPFIVASSLILFLLYRRGINKSGQSLIGQVVVMVVLVGLYVFGSIGSINCVFDQSRQSTFYVTVLNKRLKQGKKNNDYYLTLDKWGPQPKIREEKVSRKMFAKTNVGDKVVLKHGEGLLKIPWYVISDVSPNNSNP